MRPRQARYEQRHYASTCFNTKRAEGRRENPCGNQVYTGRLSFRSYQRKWFNTVNSSRMRPRVFYDLQIPNKPAF